MKPSGIGGMAAIEGVMMKNKDHYAVAVRKPDNEIVVEKKQYKSFSDKVKLFKLPVFRGVLSFVDSMVIGMKVLSFTSSFIEEEEEEKKTKKEESDKAGSLLMFFAVIASLALSIFLFMVLPVLISELFTKWIDSAFLLYLFESILRIMIFIGYILLATRMKEIKRMFMYHGAEHKTINCLENGFELTLENVKWQSKTHKRCGTSFMLYVMIISLIFFVIIRPETLYSRVVSRVLLVPLIAGISYEFIRLAGSTNNILVNILSKPGLWMQSLTTKEPDDDMIEVAIQSVEAVFDWKAFLTQDEETKEVVQAKSAETTIKAETKTVNETKKSKRVKKDTSLKDKELAKSEYAAAKEIRIASPKNRYEEEDDEILRALDKYLDFDEED
ncbi:MAG: DUF1385 domain-containing protein [Clostridiales bacterium]|nr:DUF1385 domain-containing protein [Clostridiales bacterium]